MPRNGEELRKYFDTNYNESDATFHYTAVTMSDVIHAKLTNNRMLQYPGVETLLKALDHALNYSHGAFTEKNEEVNKALEEMGKNSLLDALLKPMGNSGVTFYDYLTKDPGDKEAIDESLRQFNKYGDFGWNLSFMEPSANQNEAQQDERERTSGKQNQAQQNQAGAPEQGRKKKAAVSGEMSIDELMQKLDQTTEKGKKLIVSKLGFRPPVGDPELADAMKKFNTSRLFGQKQSRTHKKVNDAFEWLNIHTVGQNLEEYLRGDDDRKEKLAAAKEQLNAAQEAFYQADIYANQKTPLTFAGRDRMNGAKDMRSIAARKIIEAENAILKTGGKDMLREVYQQIANDRAEKARTDMLKQTTVPQMDLSGRSMEKQVMDLKSDVRRLMLDSLAAHLSKEALNNNKADTAENNFHNIRTHLEWDASLTLAVFDHIEKNWDNRSELDRWVSNPDEMIRDLRKNKSLENLDERLTKHDNVLEHRTKIMEDAEKAAKKQQNGRIME